MGGFIMLVNYIVIIAVILGVVSLYWLLHGLLLFPVKAGENTKLSVQLIVDGESHDIEHTLKGLVWLRENGTLKADIHISLNTPDESTQLIADAFSKDYHFISYNRFGE